MDTLIPPFFLPLMLLVLAQLSQFSSALNALSPGTSLSVEKRADDVLISPGGTFTCGFNELGGNAVSFSIWFSDELLPSNQRALVWSAARDQPLNNQRSRAVFRKDGNLVLIDGTSDSPVWTTNTAGLSSTAVELLDTGNLVVRDEGKQILWQSFSFPTDTLLPGQPITKDVKLVASSFLGSVSSGNHILFFDNDNVLKLMYSDPSVSSIYWPNPDTGVLANGRSTYNSTKYGVLDDKGRFVSSDTLTFNASDMDQPGRIWRRLTLDPDGNLRLYSLEVRSSMWAIIWQSWRFPCKVHGVCGRNGICTYGNGNGNGGFTPICSCPPGYEMSDPTNWKKGCRPVFQASPCSVDDGSQKWKFVELPHADFYGYDIVFNTSVSLEFCRKACEDDCKCMAFMYWRLGQGKCYTKAELHNGFTTPRFPGTLYIKVPIDLNVTAAKLVTHEPQCAGIPKEGVLPDHVERKNRTNGNSIKWAYAYGFISLFGTVELVFIVTGWWFLYRRSDSADPRNHPFENGYSAMMVNSFRKFSYRELKRATRNFHEELGRGGSGIVYRGVLDDKRAVAVKKLADVDVGKGEEEFRAELSLIGMIYHMNLVRMWGFCLERSQGFLVYEFIEKGSLDRHLFHCDDNDAKDVLDWSRRYDIALGTARGLAYLHDECLDWIIHCDIKPENILLDDDYRPKIADFGLVKLNQRGRPGSAITGIRGTKGYLAPEWTSSNVPITNKVDVYSYGVILLELIRGARLSSLVSQEVLEPVFPRLVRQLKERLATESEEEGDELLHEFMDPRLEGQFDEKQARVLLIVAASCLEEQRSKRPSMSYVLQMLSAYAKMGEPI